MSIEGITINSKEMEAVLHFVKRHSDEMAFDGNMESRDWIRSRRKNRILYSVLPTRLGIKIDRVSTDGPELLFACDEQVEEDRVIMYIHGGGFVTGSAFSKKSYCSTLAKHTGYRVYSPEYALAPENKYPSGFSDCCKAFEWVLETYPNSKVSLVGESAGGNLCLAVGLKYKDIGRIANVSVHSPVVDFSGAVDRTYYDNEDYIVKPECIAPLSRMYVGDGDVKDPFVSPILGDYTNFPPLFISCDVHETLYADSVDLYKKCRDLGVDVQMVMMSGTFHAFGVVGAGTNEASELLEKNVKFIKEK